MAERVEVVRGSAELAGPGKPFGGQSVFDRAEAHVGLSRLGPGTTTPWHHHGSRTFVGYVIEGSVVIEVGGKDQACPAGPGDFFRIPAHLIHRDVNATEATVLLATVAIGTGPLSFPAAGPSTEA